MSQRTGAGTQKQTFYIRPDQYMFLQMRALQNKASDRTNRPDLSFVVREIIDKYQEAVEAAAAASKGRRARG
jgi:hypothetical protein